MSWESSYEGAPLLAGLSDFFLSSAAVHGTSKLQAKSWSLSHRDKCLRFGVRGSRLRAEVLALRVEPLAPKLFSAGFGG